jgi:hypothetical protein
MSDMKNHVVSLEKSIILQPYLPEKFESEYCYQRINILSSSAIWHGWEAWKLICKKDKHWPASCLEVEHLHAPILSEMWKLLPSMIEISGIKYILMIDEFSKHIYYQEAHYGLNRKPKLLKAFSFPHKINPATAAAELYMWGVDNGHIDKNNP